MDIQSPTDNILNELRSNVQDQIENILKWLAEQTTISEDEINARDQVIN